jgi:hypothetical protein
MSTDRWWWLAPILIGALALAVRLIALDHTPWFDELYHFLAAQGWLAEGQLTIAEGTYDRAALFTIFTAHWMGLFGEDLVVARLPSVIAGTLLVVGVFLWTRAVAGRSAAVVAALLLALDPEVVDVGRLLRFYALHCLAFWLGAVGTYHLVTAPPATRPRALLLAAGTLICFGVAAYLQLTTWIGMLGIAAWAVLALGLPWLAGFAPRVRWGIVGGVALLGVATAAILLASGLLAELFAAYRFAPGWVAERRNEFWYYHFFLTIYYPTFWPLTALAVIIGLAYHSRVTAFCTCVVAIPLVVHSFGGMKDTRYISYFQPFLFVLWGIALGEIWPRIRPFLDDVGTRVLSWLRLGRLGRPGVFAVFAVVLGFALAANGAWVRTVATIFGVFIPPMGKPADWATAREELAPWLSSADIVLTTSDLEALYHLGRYDVLINESRLSELADRSEFSLDDRTGRPVITTPESVSLIMDCYPDGLIVSTDQTWRNPGKVGNAVANLVEVAAEEVELRSFSMRAYAWRQPNEARRAEACARLPLGLGDAAMTSVDER